MIRVPGWTGLIALLIGLGGCAASVPHEIDASSIRPLIEFVERETGYKLDPPPRIIADRERMSRDWSGTASVFAYVPKASFSDASGEPVIYIDHTRYRSGTTDGNSSLVHELTHYGQWLAYMAARRDGPDSVRVLRNQKNWICTRSTEWEATRTEIKYLRLYDPALAIRMESVNLAGYASCDGIGWSPTLFRQSESAQVLSCGFRPPPPFGCRGHAICNCDPITRYCEWIWVNC